MLPGLHSTSLHDGDGTNEPYIGDRMSLQLGVARLRQIRVQKGTLQEYFIKYNDLKVVSKIGIMGQK